MLITRSIRWMRAFAGLALGLCLSGNAMALEKVALAHSGTQIMRLPLYIAIQNGYFKDEGLDVEVVTVRSGSDGMKLLAGGTTAFSTGQLVDCVNLANQGIDCVGIAMLTQRLGNSIVVRKAISSGVHSMKDLKGKNIGITGVGSGTWQFGVFAAKLEGLSADDFNFISVGSGPTVIGAVKSGRVDAMVYADPENPQMVKDGDADWLIDMADEATHKRILGDSYLNNQIMTTATYAKAHPQNVQAFVNALQRANVWVGSHTVEETTKVLLSYPNFADQDPKQFLEAVKRTLPGGVAPNAGITKAAFDSAMRLPVAVGALDKPIPFEKLVDSTFADAAAKKYPPAK
jgi:NitT/TauT family transport system substrate-binding protein